MLEYTLVRYLLSKKSVDDRALNQGVLSALKSALRERQSPQPVGAEPLRILEIGAGVGTMVARLCEWGVIGDAEYTLVDTDATSLRAAEQHLTGWAEAAERTPDGALRLRAPSARGGAKTELELRFVHADALELVVAPESRQRYDLVVANAVLDLMEQRPALERILRAIKPGALFWFSINFDGETILLPESELDEQVMDLYHRNMDERLRDGKPSGDSKSGRHLLELVPQVGASLVAAGSSDWVVFPQAGAYPNDEAYFLHHIVHFVHGALGAHPELDRARFDAWVRSRHEQVERGELFYIAHQLDLLGRAPRAGSS
jgi:SAM-dependent methyltransferase